MCTNLAILGAPPRSYTSTVTDQSSTKNPAAASQVSPAPCFAPLRKFPAYLDLTATHPLGAPSNGGTTKMDGLPSGKFNIAMENHHF